MRKLHMGYGCISNMELHDELMKMDVHEREKLELELKNQNSGLYNSFKEWQKTYAKIYKKRMERKNKKRNFK